MKELIKEFEIKIEILSNRNDDLTWQNEYIIKEMLKKSDTNKIETLLYFFIEFIFPNRNINSMNDFFRSFISSRTNNMLPSIKSDYNIKNNNYEENCLNFKFIEKSLQNFNEIKTSKLFENNYLMLPEREDCHSDNLYQNYISSTKLDLVKIDSLKCSSNENYLNFSENDNFSHSFNKSPDDFHSINYDSDKNTTKIFTVSPNNYIKRHLGKKSKRKESSNSNSSLILKHTFSELFLNEDEII